MKFKKHIPTMFALAAMMTLGAALYVNVKTTHNEVVAYGNQVLENFEPYTALHIFLSVSRVMIDYREECNLGDLLYVNMDPLVYVKTEHATEIRVFMNENCDSCVLSFSSGMTETYYPNYHGTEVFVNLRNYLEPAQNIVNICATVYQGDCSISICEDFIYVISSIENGRVFNFNITNPVTNGKIQFSTDVIGNYEIYSIEGRLLDSGFVSGCEIDVSQLKNGVYLIRIGERTEKIVVNNL